MIERRRAARNARGGNAAQGGERARVIIQTNDPGNRVRDRVRATSEDFSSFNGVSAEVDVDRIEEIAARDDVEWVSLDRETRINSLVDDDDDDDDDTLQQSSGRSKVRTNSASLDGSGIGIAILDSGIDARQFPVRNSPTGSRVVAAANFVRHERTTDDLNGHGTMIASLAAGDARRGSGGIAPGANLINVRVLDSHGRGTMSDAIRGIEWTIRNRTRYNIRVLNISLGAPAADSFLNDPLCRAVEAATLAGIVVVTSAGNHGLNDADREIYGMISSPGIDPLAITVGSVNMHSTVSRADDTVARFSSRGPTRSWQLDRETGARVYDNVIKPDLVAPGNRLTGASPANSDYLTEEYPNIEVAPGLVRLSGTSLSAAVVSGTVALLVQRNPGLNASLVRSILQWTAQPIQNTSIFAQGAGHLNIDAAVRLAAAIRPNAATLSTGAPLLRQDARLPGAVMQLNGEEVRLGRTITANGWHLFGGNELFRLMQMPYRSEIVWYRDRLWRTVTHRQMTGNLLSRLGGNRLVLTPGVVALDSVVRANNGTLDGDLNSLGWVLPQGITFNDGVTVGEGITFADGIVYGDGIIYGDSIVLAEGITMAEGVVAGETRAMSVRINGEQ